MQCLRSRHTRRILPGWSRDLNKSSQLTYPQRFSNTIRTAPEPDAVVHGSSASQIFVHYDQVHLYIVDAYEKLSRGNDGTPFRCMRSITHLVTLFQHGCCTRGRRVQDHSLPAAQLLGLRSSCSSYVLHARQVLHPLALPDQPPEHKRSTLAITLPLYCNLGCSLQ